MNHFMIIEGKKSPPNHLPPHQVTGSAVQGTHRGQVFRVLSSVSSVLLLRGTTGAWKRRELDSPFVGNIWHHNRSMEKERAGLPFVGNICWSMEKKKEEIWNSLVWGIFATTTGAWKRRDKNFPFVRNILYHNYISPINITVVTEYNAFITDLLPQALRKISLCDIVYRKKPSRRIRGHNCFKITLTRQRGLREPRSRAGSTAQFEQDLEPQGSCPWPRGHSSELWAQHSPQLARRPRCAPRCAPKPAAPGRAGRTDLCS